tara:strand:- start:199 stop:495 length:297 start_codon:yes stop_codon:yes gene_type:complete
MKLKEIIYKKRRTKVIFVKLDDYALYEYEKNLLRIHKGLSKKLLGKTLFHEIFHIIMACNDFQVAPHGEEKVACLTEEYYTILNSNKVLKNLIINCLQ